MERDGAWVPARDVPHRLPAERDAFVGRTDDLRTLADLLDRSRLVSVLGMGGTGKTRLVTRFAWTWLGDFPGGAWFCDLSEARSVDGICHAVAAAFDVPLGKDDPVAQLGHAIAGRGDCLIVLDNFEQVARHAGETLGRWLDRAKDARFVVTTREVLGLPGESALALAPLVQDEAIGLFVARARQARQDFAPDDEPSLRALVALLDHLPLAIELAAARVRVMPPKTLLERMSQRFKLLASTGGRHTRQATLRATFDWSWELLSEDERAALAQLAVFEGGFTLEAAEAVLSLPELWPTDAVQALVDRSWVRRVADDRFDLLVSVQEYAAEKLEASGGRPAAEARHAAHFAAHGTDAALHALDRHGGAARLRAMTTELDNLVAATRRATTSGASEHAVATLCAATEVVTLQGPFDLAVALAEGVCAMAGLSPAARGRAELRLGYALRIRGEYAQALPHLERALAMAQSPDGADRRREGQALTHLGNLHHLCGRSDDAMSCHERALAIHREVGDRVYEGYALGSLGSSLHRQGQSEAARAHLEASLAIAREVGNVRGEGGTSISLGQLHQQQGRTEDALSCFERALAAAREVGNRRLEGGMISNLGLVHLEQGRTGEALACFEAALASVREVGNRHFEGIVLGNIAAVHHLRGRPDEAVAHLEAALAVHRELAARSQETRPRSTSATCTATSAGPARPAPTSRPRWPGAASSATAGRRARRWASSACRTWTTAAPTRRSPASTPAPRCCGRRSTAPRWPGCSAAARGSGGGPVGPRRRSEIWPRRRASQPRAAPAPTPTSGASSCRRAPP